VNLTRSCIVITSPRYVVQGCIACLSRGDTVARKMRGHDYCRGSRLTVSSGTADLEADVPGRQFVQVNVNIGTVPVH